ncbi:MAG: hypothetical protein NUV49_02945, partial [Patescibacteria group bacterium]|nr:hypothetical protein [Patescibacteria group bacterium]
IALLTGKSAMDSKQLADDLAAKLSAGSEAPAAVIASGNQVEVVYRDRIVTRYLPAEGGVKFNTVEYQKALSALDSLLKMREGAKPEGQSETPVANGAETPALGVTPSPAIATSIDSLKAILRDPLGSGLLKIKTWGLCARPEIGICYGTGSEFYAGVKVAYWNRYGASMGTTKNQIGIAISRRIDDVSKILRNTELLIMCGQRYDNRGVNVNFGVKVGL